MSTRVSKEQGTILTALKRETLLASYIFAAPTSAKYMSQFIRSQVSFVNQVPLELLGQFFPSRKVKNTEYTDTLIVGPAAPQSSPIDRSLRYPIDLLSVPSAQYITPSQSSQFVLECLRNPNTNAMAKGLREASRKARPKNKRSVGGQVGFFEQAIFTGLGMVGTATLLSAVTVVWFGVQFASW